VSTPLRSGTQGTVPDVQSVVICRWAGQKPVSRIEATRPARLGTWWETAYQTMSQSIHGPVAEEILPLHPGDVRSDIPSGFEDVPEVELVTPHRRDGPRG